MNNTAKDIVRDYTADYARYVATSRAIPSLTDGLKPVQRRCLNSADDLHIYHDRPFLKVSKLEGQVMGDYHPHGSADMTGLAQPFKTRYPLFEGQGNFGSPDQPGAVAASRYIETRLTEFSEDLYLSSAPYADKEDNYDGRLKEIVQYYPPIPGCLLISTGDQMAVGLSTSTPYHTVSDICRSLLSYIENPSDLSYLDMIIPETCEESIILTPKQEIRELYETGAGSISYKAKYHYETIDGKSALVVDAFPPGFRRSRIEKAVMEYVESGDLTLENESSTGIRYVFISNNKEALDTLEEVLTSKVSYRFNIEYHNCIHQYTLNEIYEDFLEDRKPYIIKKYTDLYSKDISEIEYLRVWIEFKKDKEYIRTIFDRSNKEVIDHIISTYSTTKDVASRILSASISSMLKDGDIDKMIKKKEDLLIRSQEYKSYVDDPMLRIVMDIKELYEKYKREPRRAIHYSDVKDTVTLKVNGSKMKVKSNETLYVATPDNEYSVLRASDLEKMDTSNLYVEPTDKKYYIFYDDRGLTVVTGETMSKLNNKFRSSKLSGLLGVDDLSTIEIRRSNSNRVTKIDEWWIRERLSYIQQVGEGESITILAHP